MQIATSFLRMLAVVTMVTSFVSSARCSWAEERVQVCRYCDHEHHGQEEAQSAAASMENIARNYAPDRVVDVRHIKLDVTPAFDQKTIQATATISFVPIARPLTELRLDAVDLNVQSITGTVSVARHTTSREDIVIVFDPPVAVGTESSIDIQYSAEPKKGLYFRTPSMGYPETDTHLWTQGEPHEARYWFPCFDFPNERSSTEVICHVPADMTVLSNGKLMDETESGNLKSVRWLQEKPHANYLICLVAGHLAKLEKQHGDTPLALFTQPSLAEYAPNSFQDTADIMAFFEEEIGIEFPWDKYYQVTIADFMWGGMENTSLTTLTQSTLYEDATENIHSSYGLDAHEMAHQWFGDYVTCKDWSHLWLNEGFATFYTHLYEERKLGTDEKLYGLYRDATGNILRKTDDKRPIVYKGYATPNEQFDYRAYPKGSWVLHMLRSQLGVDRYRKCIKTYLERHALSPVVTSDLVRVIEEVSGESFDRFFDQWVYHARFPDITWKYRWLPKEQMAHVIVEQTQEINDDVRLFEFPTKLRFVIDGQPVDHEIEVREKRHEFYIKLPSEPSLVRFDPEFTVLARVTFSRQPESMLITQLEQEGDVIGRLMAVQELGKRRSRAAVTALAEALNNDAFHGVRTAAASELRKIDSEQAYAALVDGLDQEDARVRRSVVSQVGKYYRADAKTTLLELLEAEDNPAIRGEIIKALGKFDRATTKPILKQALQAESFRNEELSAAIRAVAAQKNGSLQRLMRKVLTERESDMGSWQFASGLNALATISRNAKNREATRDYLIGYLSHPKSVMQAAAARALGTLGDPEATRVLASFADDRDDRLAKAAESAIEKIRDEKPMVPDEVRELRKVLDELRSDYDELENQLASLQEKWTAQIAANASEAEPVEKAAKADAAPSQPTEAITSEKAPATPPPAAARPVAPADVQPAKPIVDVVTAE